MFNLSSISANERKLRLVAFDEAKVLELERQIDEFDKELPPLTTFILPGGGKCSAQARLNAIQSFINCLDPEFMVNLNRKFFSQKNFYILGA